MLTEHDMPIAEVTYWMRKKRGVCGREQRDAWLKTEIRRVHEANFGVYGPARSGLP